jgi:DNA-binding transcriptional regulator YiaG
VGGRNSFGKLRAKIDADPERRARMDEKRKAYDVLLRLSELSDLRRERGLTQAELAEALSVSQRSPS